MRQHVPRPGRAAARSGSASAPSPRRNSGGFASPGCGSSLTMTSSSSATPAPLLRRDEAHRDQVALRAAPARAARAAPDAIDVAVVEVAVDEVGVDLDDLLDQRPVRGLDAAEVAVAVAVVEAVDDPVPPASGRLSGRHSLPNAAWICASTPGRSTPGASILLTMISRSRWRAAAWSIMRTAIGSTPVAGVDDDRDGLHRLERRQALAEEVGRAGRVDQVDPRARRASRWSTLALSEMLHAPLERVEVADHRAALQRSRRADRPRRRRAAPRRRLVLPAAAGPTSASVRIDATSAPAPDGGAWHGLVSFNGRRRVAGGGGSSVGCCLIYNR